MNRTNNPFDLIDARLSNIETMLLDLKHNPSASGGGPAVFGIDVCCDITGLAKPTIYRNTSQNLMPHYRRDGKLFFRREEIISWLTENRIKTKTERLEEMDAKFVESKSRRGAK